MFLYKNIALPIFFTIILTLNGAIAQVKIENLDKVNDTKLLLIDTKLTEAWKTNNICIPTFQINFITKSSLVVSKLKTPVPPTLANNAIVLSGIKDKTYLQITNEAYQYYINQLISLGYNVISRDVFEQNDTYKRMVLVSLDATEYKCIGSPIENQVKLTGSTHAKSFAAGNNPTLQFLNSPQNTPKITKMLKDLNTNLVDFNITIDFLEYMTQRGMTNKWDYINSTGAPATILLDSKPKLFVSAMNANFFNPSLQFANFTQKVAAGIERKYFKQMKFIYKSPEMEANFGKASKVYELVVEEEIYKAACLELIKKYIDMMVLRLKQEHK
jgi:hypothetical protein